MTPVLVDNTVLSNFANVEQPDLFLKAFDNLATTQAVLDEFKEGERLGRVPTTNWFALHIIEMTGEEQTRAVELGQTLGKGEAECLAIAELRNWMILTDDRDARRKANALSIVVSGTLGALVNLVEFNIVGLDFADNLLLLMIEKGYHSPVNSLQELGL